MAHPTFPLLLGGDDSLSFSELLEPNFFSELLNRTDCEAIFFMPAGLNRADAKLFRLGLDGARFDDTLSEFVLYTRPLILLL